jgi:AmiR/NasT family two-component response regulator
MERYKITADQAFDLLSQLSQDRNVKVRELAEELAVTGELPPPD